MERAQKLFDAEVVPRKDLETAAADHAASRAETVRAQLRLRNLAPEGAGGRGLTLRAPVGGVVADRKANPSMEVQPGMADPLFVVSDLRKLWVQIDLPERHLNDVRVGREVLVSVDAYPSETFRARIARIGQVVDASTRRIQVRCDVDNADGRLKPEMFARVTLLSEAQASVVRVPNNALVTEGLFTFAFVETAGGTFAKRKLQLAFQDRENAFVTAGIVRGERVVESGALLLQSEMTGGQ
jgi:cobalt-zinc-cadmium efflux system membrane fusion protein